MILGLTFARFFARVIHIDRRYLVPLIFIACMVGSYAINNVMYDLVTCVCFGFLGYLMMRYDYPVSPMVLAQILGSMMESNFRRSLVMSSGDPSIPVTRPIALTLLVLAVFATVTAIRPQSKSVCPQAAAGSEP